MNTPLYLVLPQIWDYRLDFGYSSSSNSTIAEPRPDPVPPLRENIDKNPLSESHRSTDVCSISRNVSFCSLPCVKCPTALKLTSFRIFSGLRKDQNPFSYADLAAKRWSWALGKRGSFVGNIKKSWKRETFPFFIPCRQGPEQISSIRLG